MIVYGALARAEALVDRNPDWWAVEAYDTDNKVIVRINPVYKDRFNLKDQEGEQ